MDWNSPTGPTRDGMRAMQYRTHVSVRVTKRGCHGENSDVVFFCTTPFLRTGPAILGPFKKGGRRPDTRYPPCSLLPSSSSSASAVSAPRTGRSATACGGEKRGQRAQPRPPAAFILAHPSTCRSSPPSRLCRSPPRRAGCVGTTFVTEHAGVTGGGARDLTLPTAPSRPNGAGPPARPQGRAPGCRG